MEVTASSITYWRASATHPCQAHSGGAVPVLRGAPTCHQRYLWYVASSPSSSLSITVIPRPKFLKPEQIWTSMGIPDKPSGIPRPRCKSGPSWKKTKNGGGKPSLRIDGLLRRYGGGKQKKNIKMTVLESTGYCDVTEGGNNVADSQNIKNFMKEVLLEFPPSFEHSLSFEILPPIPNYSPQDACQ